MVHSTAVNFCAPLTRHAILVRCRSIKPMSGIVMDWFAALSGGLSDRRNLAAGPCVLAFCIGLFPAAAQQQSRTPPNLAVLPLENNSGDGAQDYFASGLTDEIATTLANIRGLAVVARSSVFQLKPSDRDPQM